MIFPQLAAVADGVVDSVRCNLDSMKHHGPMGPGAFLKHQLVFAASFWHPNEPGSG